MDHDTAYPPAAPLQLFCLPCAGASAMMVLRWGRHLPSWIDLRPVELPGRGLRAEEPLLADMPALLEQLLTDIESDLGAGQGRFALYGHSMGGLLAYELSHLLLARGHRPAALLISGCGAPSLHDPHRFDGLDTDEALIAKLRELGGTPEEAFEDPEFLRDLLDTLAADFSVCRSFRHASRPALPLPLHVFAGRNDAIPEASVHAWQRESSAPVATHWFDGGHFFIRQSEGEFLERLVTSLRGQTRQAAMPI